jgi:hypothetical protein
VAQQGRTRILGAASGKTACAVSRFLVACWLGLTVSFACSRDTVSESAVRIAWTLDPAPPAAGVPTLVRVAVTDRQGRPVSGARLRLEGHMSHPGMVPVVVDIVESAGGIYEGRLQLSMAGDWLLVVSGALADGARVTQQLELPGVRPGA